MPDPRDFTTCHDDGRAGTQAEHGLGEHCRGVDDVLAIVEQERDLPLCDGAGDHLGG